MLGFTAMGLLGCEAKTASNNEATSSTLKEISSGNSPAANSPEANKPADKPQAEKPKPIDISKLPASLKGDAYDYYGLGRADAIKMKVNRDGSKEDATQTVSMTKVDADHAEFLISSTGALAQLGDVTVKLDKDGIRVVSMGESKVDPDTFELPNGLKKGKSWPFKLPSAGSTISGTNKVIGTETIKTSVGTYKDALVVETKASGTQAGQKVALTSKQWLVKGRGQVKAEITNVSGGKTSKITMEESN